MKELILSIIATFMIVGALIFWGILMTRSQAQEGFNSVGKMLDDVDSRLKALEVKK